MSSDSSRLNKRILTKENLSYFFNAKNFLFKHELGYWQKVQDVDANQLIVSKVYKEFITIKKFINESSAMTFLSKHEQTIQKPIETQIIP